MYTECMVLAKEKDHRAEYALTKPVHHVAFIMDGNGRWAKARGLPRHFGHKEACERIIDVLNACMEFGIQAMSLYAFSTENWKRPKSEIGHLFSYLELFFKRELKTLIADGVRVMVSGDIARLPVKTQDTIADAILKTKSCQKHIMNICLNYGGRQELVRAAKLFAQDVADGRATISSLDEVGFAKYLYTDGLPEVDLLIRTSGEFRTSNFLPWQLAYAELVFPEVYWPDFRRENFIACLKEYESRNRRFGGLKNE